MKSISFLLLCCLSISICSNAQNAEIPAWVIADWELHASGSGTWLADNSIYKNDAEPFDEYGSQWTLCPDKQCLRGRLFGKIGGREIATFWEFFCFWDVKKGKIRIIQISGNGTVGEGWNWQEPDGSTKSQQHFLNLEGSFSDSGHVTVFTTENEMTTRSFDVSGENWTVRRVYFWKKTKP